MRPDEPVLGILMLDTRFPRLRGDIGHPETFSFATRRVVVHGATPSRVVRDDDPALLRPFVDAASGLVEAGADAIATSCGFLACRQRELQAALPVPVWTSSLLVLPELAPRRAGVVTIDAGSLTARHFEAVDADPATPVEGIAAGSPLQRTLLDNRPDLDPEDAERQVLAAARRLLARVPGLDAIVLECTNLPPYADAVRRATGIAVHDVVTLLEARMAALAGRARPAVTPVQRPAA